jgi:hypothetical protein
MRKRIQVSHVVALEFKARAVSLAKPVEYLFDVGEGIAKNPVSRGFEKRSLPRMIKVGVA